MHYPNPQQATRQIVAAALASLALTAGGAIATESARDRTEVRMPDGIGSKVIVHGCGPEDGCKINYRGRSSDWALTRVNP